MAEYIIIGLVVACTVLLSIRYFSGSIKDKLESASARVSSLRKPGAAESAGSIEGSRASGVIASNPGAVGPPDAPPSEPNNKTSPPLSKTAQLLGKGQDISGLQRGVGDSLPEEAAVKEIRLDFSSLLLLGLACCAAGLLILFRGRFRRRRKTELPTEESDRKLTAQ